METFSSSHCTFHCSSQCSFNLPRSCFFLNFSLPFFGIPGTQISFCLFHIMLLDTQYFCICCTRHHFVFKDINLCFLLPDVSNSVMLSFLLTAKDLPHSCLRATPITNFLLELLCSWYLVLLCSPLLTQCCR